MNITPIKTHSITSTDSSIASLLDQYIKSISEKSIIAVTSKIVSICEGSIVPLQSTNKETLVEQEADYFLPKNINPYGFHFTIKNNTMIASAGIDVSNGNGYYILWPRNPQKSANDIRQHLCKKHGVKHIGVIIVDSKTIPLRRGTVGTTLSASGFLAIHDYRGTKDLFGYTMRVSTANIAEGLGAAAVLAMGEGTESTPIVVMEDLPNVVFQEHNPTNAELEETSISLEDDLYAPILKGAPWIRGKKRIR